VAIERSTEERGRSILTEIYRDNKQDFFWSRQTILLHTLKSTTSSPSINVFWETAHRRRTFAYLMFISHTYIHIYIRSVLKVYSFRSMYCLYVKWTFLLLTLDFASITAPLSSRSCMAERWPSEAAVHRAVTPY
jgi:hypothetical protein